MRFLSLITQVSGLLVNHNFCIPNANNGIIGSSKNCFSRSNLMCCLYQQKREVSSSGEERFFKLVPVTCDEAEGVPATELIPIDYIKKLEEENAALTKKLKDRCHLISSLNGNLKKIESDRMLCMIFETYQRFRSDVNGKEGEDNMKLDALLEAVRKGKMFSNSQIIHLMAEFETSDEFKLLKEFRNEYAHFTSTDLSVLRQWRSQLLDESCQSHGSVSLMSDAALKILNLVIGEMSGSQQIKRNELRRLKELKNQQKEAKHQTETLETNKKKQKQEQEKVSLLKIKKVSKKKKKRRNVIMKRTRKNRR